MAAAHPTPMIAPRSSGHLDEGSRGAQTAAGEQIERQPWEVIGSAQSEKVNGGLPRHILVYPSQVETPLLKRVHLFFCAVSKPCDHSHG